MALKRRAKNGHDVDARIQALKEDFESLQDDMRGLLSSLGGEATRRVNGATEAASGAAVRAAERLEEYAVEGVDTVREQIRSQPIAAIALSMSAGAILGAWLRR